MPTPVIVPLINPNEPDALLAALYVDPGQHVSAGDLLFTLETTKSTADLSAEVEGYVAGLRFHAGQTVRSGETLCYLAESPDWRPPQPPDEQAAGVEGLSSALPLPEGLRITRPALALASQHNLDLTSLPVGPLLTENMVKAHLDAKGTAETAFTAPADPFDPLAILIYGGGGHGKMVIDLLRALGTYHLAGIVDDGQQAGSTVMGVPVLGGAGALPGLHQQGVRLAANAVGGIGNINTRIKIFKRLAEAGFACPAIAHPTAYLDPSASLAAGAQVFVHAYVGGEVSVGYGCIINTGVIVSHDCVLGNFVNLSPGAILAGEVQVGDGALIGMGVTVNLGVKIGAGARIGNAATVKADVPAGGIVKAGAIWPA